VYRERCNKAVDEPTAIMVKCSMLGDNCVARGLIILVNNAFETCNMMCVADTYLDGMSGATVCALGRGDILSIVIAMMHCLARSSKARSRWP
jgi:hypothetical protein